MKPSIGHDLTKWYIWRKDDAGWFVCPPSRSGHLLSDCPRASKFNTGAEALAAFNAEAMK